MTQSQPILVFDLDDTLFNELDYARSGLQTVAGKIADEVGVKENELTEIFFNALAESRSNIFNRVFDEIGVDNNALIKKCIAMYRTHKPSIELYPEASKCLQRFASWRKFIVTDGNSTAQNSKIVALNLRDNVEHAYITYRYGHKYTKPSPHCFNLIAKRTKQQPQNIIYIGDNPTKDFVGIRPLGFGTIRVLTGQHKDINLTPKHAADVSIPDLSHLTADFIAEYQKNRA